MGNYNPHAPYIIGQEWVPIRQADYIPDNGVTEQGYTFSLGHATTIVSGAYYTKDPTPGIARVWAEFMAVYPAGEEDQTGPIKSVIVPCNAADVTGTGITATVADLANPSDSLAATFQAGAGFGGTLGLGFAVPSFSQQLFGKRILDVRLLYCAALSSSLGTPAALAAFLVQGRRPALGSAEINYSEGIQGGFVGSATVGIDSISLTDLNPYWQSGVTAFTQSRIYPWRYQELVNFSPGAGSAADRLSIIFNPNTLQSSAFTNFNDNVSLLYAALEVIYCEEKRVLYGGDTNLSGTNPYLPTPGGGKYTHLRTTGFAIPSANLAVGDYTVTHTHRDLVANSSVGPIQPLLRAIRELYQLPNQRGIQVNRSLTLEDTFTVTGTTVLPHLTLHHSAGVVTGVHAYGTQIDVPVYGTITAVQEIEDDPVGAAATFPQVRFYARRFGDTTVALRLIDVATGLSTASITVAEFDALPEIVDGWKEINLRFATPPTFATAAGDVDWRWDAVGETAGNQWQVLGCDGPSVTGTQAIGPATYFAPVGNTVALTWQSPAISGLAEDPLADAVLIFSQDPPAVTGFAITTGTQPITGISIDCGVPSNCIPTGIYCNQLSWSAQTALPVTGFGYYELQRSDTVEPDNWQTILQATSTTVTGFCDYEARTGVLSSYRIRVCNVLDFCGAWATGSATIPSPGVTGPGGFGSGNSVLIFTSNTGPTGNLAYRMQFDGTPIEQFAFPEADEVQLQRMFGKDFPTAFHPLERGGDRFQRVMLVSAAAIPVPSLANFHGLRDLAWAQLPYLCVRDELGNRWYANVRVPSGTVRRDRTLYFAQIEVSEVTDTPAPVDP